MWEIRLNKLAEQNNNSYHLGISAHKRTWEVRLQDGGRQYFLSTIKARSEHNVSYFRKRWSCYRVLMSNIKACEALRIRHKPSVCTGSHFLIQYEPLSIFGSGECASERVVVLGSVLHEQQTCQGPLRKNKSAEKSDVWIALASYKRWSEEVSRGMLYYRRGMKIMQQSTEGGTCFCSLPICCQALVESHAPWETINRNKIRTEAK